MILDLTILLTSVILHEYAHGRAAHALGDPTAQLAGRLTLNPIPHLDLYGSVVFPLILMLIKSPVMIGWAKPVPIDTFNLRYPRRDSALIAAAGPAVNLTLAVLASAALYITQDATGGVWVGVWVGVWYTCIRVIQINILLTLFNLLPISPLDGFNIVAGMLPKKMASEWYGLRRYGLLLMVIMILPLGRYSFFEILAGPILSFVTQLLIPVRMLLGTG